MGKNTATVSVIVPVYNVCGGGYEDVLTVS